jgi:hypothetical protein
VVKKLEKVHAHGVWYSLYVFMIEF